MWVKMPYYHSSKSILRAWHMLLFAWRLLRLPTHILPKPDNIVVSSPSPFPILNAARWCRTYGAKLVFEVRDLWPLSVIHLGNVKVSHPFIRLLQYIEHFAYRRSDAVVSVLSHSRGYMTEHGMAPEKFNYIPNGIDIDEIRTKNDPDEEVLALLPKGKFIVGYVGALGIANDLTYLIDAARKLRTEDGIHFVLVGEGSEEESLRSYAEGLDNVTFTGSVSKSRVQSVLALFDLCFISLKKEKLFHYGVSPNKMFDYMAAAKPVLYAVESGNNMVKEAECGVQVEPQNVEKIAQSIVDISRLTPTERIKWGENGYNFLLQYHTFSVLAKRYSTVFEKI